MTGFRSTARHAIRRLCGLMLALAPVLADGQWSEDEQAERLGVGDPRAGEVAALAAGCPVCHGAPQPTPTPRLEGQPAAYTRAQLARFDSGQRRHPAIAVGPGERDDIAAWYASQPLAAAIPAVDDAASARLFAHGDRSREVIACVSCHGGAGRGAVSGSDGYPAIGGQSADYLRARLRHWRAGPADPRDVTVMHLIARPLVDAEIDALSAWLAALPAAP